MYSPNNYVNCKDFSHKGINIGYVEINLNEVYKKPLDKAYIIGMGDFHADSFAFNEGKLINFFNWCKETNTRVLITGDILEMAVVDSVSFTYGQSTPWQDLSKATDILYRYKDLIDGVVSGNHDERIQKRSGIDVLREFCKYNGIPYHANGLVVVYKLGVHKGTKNTFSYTVFVTHTRRGGRTPGSQVNKLVDLSNVIDADIFFSWAHSRLNGPETSIFFYRLTPSQDCEENTGVCQLWVVPRICRLSCTKESTPDKNGGSKDKTRRDQKRRPYVHINLSYLDSESIS